MGGHAFYLAGDSYPEQSHIQTEIARRLRRRFTSFLSQGMLLALTGRARFEREPERRLLLLRLALALTGRQTKNSVLIGRSSGTRVATRFALCERLAGVICLGYPFRAPGAPRDPHRFAHLARLTTPTLILQGVEDEYGGREAEGQYELAACVNLQFIPGGHNLVLSGDGWEDVATRIGRFLDERVNPG